jgi:hypothetical protein
MAVAHGGEGTDVGASQFSTNLAVDGAGVTAFYRGSAESDGFDALAKFIDEIDAAAKREGAMRVSADVRDLEFATSSCLKVLAGWVISVEERSDQYIVEFLGNSKHSWQRRSLRALAACAPAVVQVTTP